MPGLPAAAGRRIRRVRAPGNTGGQHRRAQKTRGPGLNGRSPAHPDRPENGRQNRNPSVTARAWRSMSVVNSSLAFTPISCPVAVSYSSA